LAVFTFNNLRIAALYLKVLTCLCRDINFHAPNAQTRASHGRCCQEATQPIQHDRQMGVPRRAQPQAGLSLRATRAIESEEGACRAMPQRTAPPQQHASYPVYHDGGANVGAYNAYAGNAMHGGAPRHPDRPNCPPMLRVLLTFICCMCLLLVCAIFATVALFPFAAFSETARDRWSLVEPRNPTSLETATHRALDADLKINPPAPSIPMPPPTLPSPTAPPRIKTSRHHEVALKLDDLLSRLRVIAPRHAGALDWSRTHAVLPSWFVRPTDSERALLRAANVTPPLDLEILVGDLVLVVAHLVRATDRRTNATHVRN
jgi:hypothetical protein